MPFGLGEAPATFQGRPWTGKLYGSISLLIYSVTWDDLSIKCYSARYYRMDLTNQSE